MALPEYDDAFERAADKPAFSNATEWECWSDRWCNRCKNDESEGCPLVLVAMLDKTPAEWKPKDRLSLGDQYECDEFVAAS